MATCVCVRLMLPSVAAGQTAPLHGACGDCGFQKAFSELAIFPFNGWRFIACVPAHFSVANRKLVKPSSIDNS